MIPLDWGGRGSTKQLRISQNGTQCLTFKKSILVQKSCSYSHFLKTQWFPAKQFRSLKLFALTPEADFQLFTPASRNTSLCRMRPTNFFRLDSSGFAGCVVDVTSRGTLIDLIAARTGQITKRHRSCQWERATQSSPLSRRQGSVRRATTTS